MTGRAADGSKQAAAQAHIRSVRLLHALPCGRLEGRQVAGDIPPTLRVGYGGHDGAGAKRPGRFQPSGQPSRSDARAKPAQIGSLTTVERDRLAAMTVDAAQFLEEVSAALDPRVEVIGLLHGSVEEHGSGQRLGRKLRRLPAR